MWWLMGLFLVWSIWGSLLVEEWMQTLPQHLSKPWQRIDESTPRPWSVNSDFVINLFMLEFWEGYWELVSWQEILQRQVRIFKCLRFREIRTRNIRIQKNKTMLATIATNIASLVRSEKLVWIKFERVLNEGAFEAIELFSTRRFQSKKI